MTATVCSSCDLYKTNHVQQTLNSTEASCSDLHGKLLLVFRQCEHNVSQCLNLSRCALVTPVKTTVQSSRAHEREQQPDTQTY